MKSTASATTRPPTTASSRVDFVWQKWTSRGEDERETVRESENNRPVGKKSSYKLLLKATFILFLLGTETFLTVSLTPLTHFHSLFFCKRCRLHFHREKENILFISARSFRPPLSLIRAGERERKKASVKVLINQCLHVARARRACMHAVNACTPACRGVTCVRA